MQRMTRRGIDWLAAAADEPMKCKAVWADDPRRPCVLPTGKHFDAVVLDERVGLETFDQLDRRRLPLGPVMVDHASRQVGFLLPAKSEQRFARLLPEGADDGSPAHKYLGVGGHIVVPGPIALSGDRYEWLRAPVRHSDWSPARIAALAAMFVAAHSLLVRADQYGRELSRGC
ncbi:hypothetical protein D7M15_20960 [Streptomyces sp. Z26]|nr:hypothetical protein D7M15_20960 [Streptomyces sp. Z26]